MEKPAAYSGHGPYAFACYAHSDSEQVFEDISWLKDHGVDIWYDEGIRSGSEWSEYLANKLVSARKFIFFVSPASVESKHCRGEVQFAFNRDTPFVVVYLTKTKLTAGLELSLGSTQALLKSELSVDRYRNKLLESFPADSDVVATEAPVYAAQGATPKENKLAVLPFLNLSGDPDSEYFSQGIAEEILNLLAKSKTLRVVARSSSFRFKPNEEDIRDIAKTLGVSHVVEGSVRKAAGKVRVSANLIEGVDGSQLWSESYDRELSDIFEIQEQISQAIAAELQSQLTPAKPSKKSNQSVAAHDLYLQGTHQLWQGTLQSLYDAIGYFNQALDADGNFADAYALLAYAYMLTCADPQADRPLEHNLDRFQRAAEKSLQLDPESDKANLSMGMFKMAVHEWSESERFFIKSLSINRYSPQALGYYGYFLANTRRMEKGARYANHAVETDPFNCHELARKAQLFSYIGDNDAAMEAALRALAIDPDYTTPHVWLVGIYGAMGDHESAIHSMQRWNLVDMQLGDHQASGFLDVLHRDGIEGYLEQWYQWLAGKEQRGARSPHLNWFLALYATLTGRTDAAFEHIEAAWTQTFLVPDLVFFNALKQDPRWQQMLTKQKLRDEDIVDLEALAAQYRTEIDYQDPF